MVQVAAKAAAKEGKRGSEFLTSLVSQRPSMFFSTPTRVSLRVVGVLNGVLLRHWKEESCQHLVSSHLSTTQNFIPTTSTKSRKSRFLRATPSGSVSLTLTVNHDLIPSQSPTKMAQDLDSLTEG